MKRSNNNRSRRTDMALTSLSRVGYLSLMLSLASKATAFQSSPKEPLAMLQRSALRDSSTEFYGRQNFPSPRKSATKESSTSTRLQYKDGSEDPTSTRSSLIGGGWLNNLFSSQSDATNEQESVDEYLEFLGRRYNRLHEEVEEEKPFSAINWLLNGGGKDGQVLASHQQKEDALYVLGVAGLASQKLLQKHPHRIADNQEAPAPTLSDAIPVQIDALDTFATSAETVTFGHMFIHKVLVPIAKFLYFMNRRKQMFLNVYSQKARNLAIRAAKSTARGLFYGPISLTKLVLEVGGGKRNIVSTLAFASTVLVLSRPVVQAIVTEGSVSP